MGVSVKERKPVLAQGGLPIDLVERVEKAFQDLHLNSLTAALHGPSLKLEGNALGAEECVTESAVFSLFR